MLVKDGLTFALQTEREEKCWQEAIPSFYDLTGILPNFSTALCLFCFHSSGSFILNVTSYVLSRQD